jgi:hypothetical protein
LIVWATILGAAGAFLAIPLSLLVKSLFVDVDPEHDWVAPLLSSGEPKVKGHPTAPAEAAVTLPESAEAAPAEPGAAAAPVPPQGNRDQSAPAS